MRGNKIIKPIQLTLIVFIAQTGVGAIMLPSLLAKKAGHDGWISILVTAVPVLLVSILIFFLLKRYTDKDIYHINKLLYGKIIGTGINALLILYLLGTAIAGAAMFSYFIRITLLPQTPPWILAPFITLPTFYLVWQGLKSVSRFLFISVMNYFVLLFFIILLYREYRWSFLLPLYETGYIGIYRSMKESFFAFIGFELIIFFYPYIDNKKNSLKYYLLGTVASAAFFIIVVLASTAIFGENFLKLLPMPFFSLSRVYNAPIFERIDLYLITLWFIPMACSLRNYVYAAFEGLQTVFRIPKTKLFYITFFIVIQILSSIPKDFNQVLKLFEMVNMAALGTTAYLILCFLLSFVRKKGVNMS